MAVLSCALCEEAADFPVEDQGRIFCCHGCAQLYEVLGEEEIYRLKSRPGLDWSFLRDQNTSDASTAGKGTDMCTLHLEGIWCASCTVLVSTVLKRTHGVVSASVDFASSSADVFFDSHTINVAEISQTVERLGYGVRETDNGVSAADRMLMRRFSVAAILSLLDMMVSLPVWFGYFSGFAVSVRWAFAGILWGLSTPVVFWAGWPFLRGAVLSVRHRVPTMDLLISIGSLSAYIYSFVSMAQGGSYLYFDTASLLISFLLLSRSLEAGARQRASRAVEMLLGSSVKTAVKVTDDGEKTVPTSELVVGDSVLVRSGDVVPADGIVSSGTSAFDEAIVTGEALPVPKRIEDIVYAGTVCLDGRIVVEVTRIGTDTLLGQTTSIVQAAQEIQNRRQKVVQKVLNIFVPIVLTTGILAFFVTDFFWHQSFSDAMLRAISVLVIACPCSLSIAVPLLSAGAISKLSQSGLLLRRPDFLERARNIDTVIFDKTGTLTRGEFRLVQMFSESDEVLRLAASVQLRSRHPVGQAIVHEARLRHLTLEFADSYRSHLGRGVSGDVSGRHVTVESWNANDTDLHDEYETHAVLWDKAGLTVCTVQVDGVVVGVFGLGEELRSSAQASVRSIRKAGKKVVMLSGDTYGSCQTVAAELGIDEWRSGQQPASKASYVEQLQTEGHTVAFIGDGVNDVAALTQSDIGIALRSGADIAIQSGDLVLTGTNLESVADAIQVGERASSLLRMNLTWAIVYNLCGVIVAVAGLASPAVAALAMAMSSTFVLGNSLRILDWSLFRYGGRLAMISGAIVLFAACAWFGI